MYSFGPLFRPATSYFYRARHQIQWHPCHLLLKDQCCILHTDGHKFDYSFLINIVLICYYIYEFWAVFQTTHNTLAYYICNQMFYYSHSLFTLPVIYWINWQIFHQPLSHSSSEQIKSLAKELYGQKS